MVLTNIYNLLSLTSIGKINLFARALAVWVKGIQGMHEVLSHVQSHEKPFYGLNYLTVLSTNA